MGNEPRPRRAKLRSLRRYYPDQVQWVDARMRLSASFKAPQRIFASTGIGRNGGRVKQRNNLGLEGRAEITT